MKTKKRLLSLLLCGTMLFSLMPQMVLAEAAQDSGVTIGTSGLCEHHKAHDENCGYTEGTEETPCAHEDTGDCYTLVENCIYESGDSVSGNTASPSDAEEADDHVCSEKSGCVTKELDCSHEHDETCGYIEAAPCTFVCEECKTQGSGVPKPPKEPECVCADLCTEESVNVDCPICSTEDADLSVCEGKATVKTISAWEWVDQEGSLIDGELALPGASAENTVLFEDIVSLLPTEIIATIGVGEETLVLAWACERYLAEGAYQGEYIFTAGLLEGYVLAKDVNPLNIKVVLGGVSLLLGETGDFTVEGGRYGDDYEYTPPVYDTADPTKLVTSGILTIKSSTELTISGTTTTDRIVIDSSCTGGNAANVTLDGVSIQFNDGDGWSASGTCSFEVSDSAACNLTLSGENTLKSGSQKAGLQVQENASATIEGTGMLNVTGGVYGAGIGGGIGGNGGKITIIGNAVVNAKGGDSGTGIGGGHNGNGGEITIGENAEVTATGGEMAAGIGIGGTKGHGMMSVTITGGVVKAFGGRGSSNQHGIGSSGGANGTVIITITGGVVHASGSVSYGATGGLGLTVGDPPTSDITIQNAVVFTNNTTASLTTITSKEGISGIIFNNNEKGKVYGSPTISDDMEIPSDKTLEIENGKTLTIDSSATLTNYGTIDYSTGGTLIINGVINNYGTITPDLSGENVNDKRSAVTLSISPASIDYGGTVTLTATITEAPLPTFASRSIPQQKVKFYIGETLLHEASVNSADGVFTATYSFTADSSTIKIGENTITAKYTGGNNKFLPDDVTETLTVNKAAQAISFASSSLVKIYGEPSFTNELIQTTVEGTITYTSSEPSVAMVNDSTGEVEMLKVGNTTITATVAETDTHNQAQTSYTLTVNKADQAAFSITGQPSTAIIYGDMFTLNTSGGTGDGTVTWEVTSGSSYAAVDNSGVVTIIGVGSVTITATKAGDDYYNDAKAGYTFTTVKAIPVNPTTPILPAMDYSPDKTMDDITLPIGWQWDAPTTTPTSDVSSYAAYYAVNNWMNYDWSDIEGYNNDTKRVERMVALTVNKIAPTCMAPTGLTATYGQTLRDVTLINPEGNTPGTWSWMEDDAIPVGNTGSQTYNARFTPIDTINYKTVENIPVTMQVEQAVPTYTVPAGLTATYGQTLRDITLTNPDGNTPGTWNWMENGSTTVGDAGSQTHKARFTPTDVINYKTVENIPVTVQVDKAAPTCMAPTGLTVIYGQILWDAILINPDGNTPGTWNWMEDGSTTVGDAGSQTHNARFIPTDTINYIIVENIPVTVQVEQAPPICIAPTGLIAIYGQTLRDVILINPDGNTPGTWNWMEDSLTTVGDAGSQTYNARFIPTDAINYKTVENIPVMVQVEQAVPTCMAPNGLIATYGQTLGDVILINPDGNTPGTWNWMEDSSMTVGDAGSQIHNAIFIPTDIANYKTVDNIPVTMQVDKASGEAVSNVTGGYAVDRDDLDKFVYIVAPIEGAEYQMDGTADENWRDSNVFSGIVPESSHTFYVRMKGDRNYEAGAIGSVGPVTFSKLTRSGNPTLDYTVTGRTGSKKITITAVDGCQYTFDGGATWGSANEQTFSQDTTQTIGIRYQETATHSASSGTIQEISLNEEQDAPDSFILTFTDNGNGTFTAVIPMVVGGEYSFDGNNWSGDNTKTDCQANTAYTGYVRLAAKNGYNPSPVTSDTQTTPWLIASNPVLSPNGGNFTGSQSVSITTSTPGATIYYTTDGSAPTVFSPKYTAPFTISTSATVQAIAMREGYESSGVATAVFTKQSGGGSSSPKPARSSGSAPIAPAVPTLPSYVVKGIWTMTSEGVWTFTDEKGTAYRNAWAAIYNPYANTAFGQNPFDWFYFDGEGRMMTRWLEDNKRWYYLNPLSNGTRGRMLTGWQKIDGRWYYFNEVSDGTRGAMMTDAWIGAYYVDKDGIWKED